MQHTSTTILMGIEFGVMFQHQYKREQSSRQPASTPAMTEQISTQPPAKRAKISQIPVSELKRLLDTEAEDLILIDVRYPEEYEIDHLPDAVLVPFPEIQDGCGIRWIRETIAAWQNTHPDRSYHLIVYCTAGVGSYRALQLLSRAGIVGTNLKGGIKAWQRTQRSATQSYPQTAYSLASMNPLQPKRLNLSLPLKFGRFGWLQAGLCSAAIVVGLTTWYGTKVVHDPDRLRPMIQAGVPLDLISGLPVLGEAVQAAELPQISVQQLKQLLESNPQEYLLVDVRTPQEYADSSIPGAISVPLAEVEQGIGAAKITSLQHGRKLLVYCTSGYRSGKALVKLQKAGLQGTHIKGGIAAWFDAKQPTVSHK